MKTQLIILLVLAFATFTTSASAINDNLKTDSDTVINPSQQIILQAENALKVAREYEILRNTTKNVNQIRSKRHENYHLKKVLKDALTTLVFQKMTPTDKQKLTKLMNQLGLSLDNYLNHEK